MPTTPGLVLLQRGDLADRRQNPGEPQNVSTKLGQLIRTHRRRRRLTPQRLAGMLGMRAEKGARRIVMLEQEDHTDPDLLDHIVRALEVPSHDVEVAMEADSKRRYEDARAAAQRPRKPRLVVRIGPGLYLEAELPEELRTQADLEQHARELASRSGKRVCLTVGTCSTWISATGDIEGRTEAALGDDSHGPGIRIRGRSAPLPRISPGDKS